MAIVATYSIQNSGFVPMHDQLTIKCELDMFSWVPGGVKLLCIVMPWYILDCSHEMYAKL